MTRTPGRKTRSRPDEAQPHDDYVVGYGRPPEHARFKRGRSGNPHGRPRHRRSFATVLRQTLSETVVIREGDRVRKVPTLEALVRATVNRALRRDPKAMASILMFLRATGMLEDDAATESITQALTENDSAILQSFLSRRGAGPDPKPSKSRKTSSTKPRQP